MTPEQLVKDAKVMLDRIDCFGSQQLSSQLKLTILRTVANNLKEAIKLLGNKDEQRCFRLTRSNRYDEKTWPDWFKKAFDQGSISRCGQDMLQVQTIDGKVVISWGTYVVEHKGLLYWSHVPRIKFKEE